MYIMSRSDTPGGNFDFIANRNEAGCGLSEKRQPLGRMRSTQNRAPRGSRKSSYNNRKGHQRRVQSERQFSGHETCMNEAHQSRRDDNGNDLSPAPAPLDRKGRSSTNQGLTVRRPRGESLQSTRNISTMFNKYEEFSSSTESQTLSAVSGGGPEIQALKKSQPVPNDQRPEQQSGGMFLQPEIHPMTEEELKNEIRGIYGGLSMVEQKCIELVKHYNENLDKLDEVAWQTLLTLHRSLLHEHFDFFLATNHRVAESFVPETMPNETTQKSSTDSIQQSPNEELRGLAKKYSMPARMWRYGIHAFLELLRKKLPSSLEHMLSFIYMAYSMMSLLLESVPEFQETWIECLGDLARYRMAIEELDMRDREVYMGVARYWYIKAAELNPEVGRIQHHLAVLARPNLLQQLFYYTKALISVRAFSNARDSISLLFSPLLDPEKAATKYSRHYPRLLIVLVEAHGILFTRRDSATFLRLADEFLSDLDQHAGMVGPLFREQGIYITASNYAAILDYGQDDAEIPPLFNRAELTHDKREEILDIAYKYWQESACIQKGIEARMSGLQTPQISGTEQVSSLASHLAFTTLDIILERLGDRNTLPSVHISLAFLWCLAMVPESMERIQADVPWLGLAKYLNALIKPDTNLSEIEQGDFPAQESGPSQQLPEDFLILGFSWSRLYFPRDFFAVMAEEAERTIEFPTVTIPRTRRCLWLAFRIAKFRRWLVYDSESRQFQATQYAHELAMLSGQYQLLRQDRSSSSRADQDVEMSGP